MLERIKVTPKRDFDAEFDKCNTLSQLRSKIKEKQQYDSKVIAVAKDISQRKRLDISRVERG